MSARNSVARPESVTVTAWVLLVFCGFGYLSLPMIWYMRDLPTMQAMLAHALVPASVYIVIVLAHVTIDSLCAVAFLLRQGWARYVYLVTGAVMMVYSWWISPFPIFVIPSSLWVAGVAIVLFLPKANRWFAGEDVAAV